MPAGAASKRDHSRTSQEDPEALCAGLRNGSRAEVAQLEAVEGG
ncbi:MAG: hypothetical protein RLZ45_1578, partial [Verrucomicrobiota bacterium]